MIYQLSGLITEYDHCCLFNVLLSRKIEDIKKELMFVYTICKLHGNVSKSDFLEKEMSDPLIG